MSSKSLPGRLRAYLANKLNLIYPPQDIRPFCPNSSGSHSDISKLTTLAANQSLICLAKVASIASTDLVKTRKVGLSLKTFLSAVWRLGKLPFPFFNQRDTAAGSLTEQRTTFLAWPRILRLVLRDRYGTCVNC